MWAWRDVILPNKSSCQPIYILFLTKDLSAKLELLYTSEPSCHVYLASTLPTEPCPESVSLLSLHFDTNKVRLEIFF